MRTLKFIVEGQNLKLDPDCDLVSLFPGNNSTVKAVFTLSQEWKNTPKVAAFQSMLGTEYPPRLLDDENSCEIPLEALKLPAFRIKLLRKQRNATISTNAVAIYQKGGRS